MKLFLESLNVLLRLFLVTGISFFSAQLSGNSYEITASFNIKKEERTTVIYGDVVNNYNNFNYIGSENKKNE